MNNNFRIVKKIAQLVLVGALALTLAGCASFFNKPSENGISNNESGLPVYDNPFILPTPTPFALYDTEIPPVQENASEHSTVATATPTPNTVRLIAVGDNLIHEPIIKNAKRDNGYDFNPVYENITKYIQAADIAVVNQETLFGGPNYPYSGYPQFSTPDEMGDALVNAGFDVVLQASNHFTDKPYDAQRHCIEYWPSAHPDILHLGVNSTPEDQRTIHTITSNGITIAMINYTDIVNHTPYKENMTSANLYMINYLNGSYGEDKLREDISKAREIADVVVVFPHWGTEYSYTANKTQEYYTELFRSLNVDLVIGTHPHVLQPMQEFDRPDGKKMLVYYSLGNFVSTQEEIPRMLGGMADVTFEKDTDGNVIIKDHSLLPLVTHYEGSQTKENIRVYSLEDYTDELAEKHSIKYYSSEKKSLNINELWNLYNSILNQ